MATKEQLIKNLREYSAAEIAQAIRDGQVSIYELSKSGNLSPLMRRRIEAQLAEAPAPAAAPASEAAVSAAPEAAMAAATETATAVATEETAIHPTPEPQPAQPVRQTQPVQEQVQAQAPVPPPFVQAPPMPPAYQQAPQVQQAPSISPQVNAQSYPLYEGPNAIDNHGMFRRPMSIKGRIRRTEFCLSYLMYLLIVPIFAFMAEESDYNPALSVATLLIYVIGIWFMIAQGTKRCHDLGHSGWYQLIPFYFLVMMFGPGEEGYNEYGSDPKQ